jgi:hypothetical protein
MYRPHDALREDETQRRVNYWINRADVVCTSVLFDGIGKWDLLPFNGLSIDTKLWKPKEHYHQYDGSCGTVVVMHTPNHRGFKGTEFLVEAINEL